MERTVGFIIDSIIPGLQSVARGKCGPLALLKGAMTGSSVALMRYGWIAEAAGRLQKEMRYELFRPHKKFDVIVFLKSMGPECEHLQERLALKGVKTVFDANVDYFSTPTGVEYYEGMFPRTDQVESARRMACNCDGVICDSSHIANIACQYSRNSTCITDNVKDSFIASESEWKPGTGKLMLLWSGESVKLFDLLNIKQVLLSLKAKVKLRIITNALDSLRLWSESTRRDFNDLLSQVEHEIISFTTVEDLLKIYDKGGIFISPRYLNNSYNLGHTEWKIALAMARGRYVLCSPQQSYIELHNLASSKGVRVCRTDNEWHAAINELATREFDWFGEQAAACSVVRKYYASSVLALKHLNFIKSVNDAHGS